MARSASVVSSGRVAVVLLAVALFVVCYSASKNLVAFLPEEKSEGRRAYSGHAKDSQRQRLIGTTATHTNYTQQAYSQKEKTLQTEPSRFNSSNDTQQFTEQRETGGIEGKIISTLGSIVHVTHTHTSSNDTWMAAFDALEEHGRGNSSSSLGRNVRFVVCTERKHPDLDRWPWLEVVEYGYRIVQIGPDKNGTEDHWYPPKVVNCLREVTRRHDPKFVLHTMEDMIPTGPIRWELVAAGARILAASPNASFFRFTCYNTVNHHDCQDLKDEGVKTAAKKSQLELPTVENCGSCTAGDYEGVFYTDNFSVVPLLVRPKEWIEFHERHSERKTVSGSKMESYSFSHHEEPGPGLQGFVDGTKGVVHHAGNDTPRKFAYPYIHTGVQFGMWRTADFPESLCPAMEKQGTVEAGPMGCKADLNATPPCLCDGGTCITEDGRALRKFWRVGGPEKHPFPAGCAGWVERGRPRPPPISPAGPKVEAALREQGLWEAPDLDEAWDRDGDS